MRWADTIGAIGVPALAAGGGFTGASLLVVPGLPGTTSTCPARIRLMFLSLLARARASTLTPRRRATPLKVPPRRTVYRLTAAEPATTRAATVMRVRSRRMTNQEAPPSDRSRYTSHIRHI